MKLKVDGLNWVYASKRNVRQMVQGVRPSVVFSGIDDKEGAA